MKAIKDYKSMKSIKSSLIIIAIGVHKFVKAEQSYGLLVSNSHENIMIILGYLLSSQRFWLHEPFSRLKHYKNVRVFVDYIGKSHGIN